MDEGADAAAVLLRAGDDGGDFVAVGEGEVAACRVDEELLPEVFQKARRVGCKQCLEFADVGEFPLVGQRAAALRSSPPFCFSSS